jgi:hypothetical protein
VCRPACDATWRDVAGVCDDVAAELKGEGEEYGSLHDDDDDDDDDDLAELKGEGEEYGSLHDVTMMMMMILQS